MGASRKLSVSVAWLGAGGPAKEIRLGPRWPRRLYHPVPSLAIVRQDATRIVIYSGRRP